MDIRESMKEAMLGCLAWLPTCAHLGDLLLALTGFLTAE